MRRAHGPAAAWLLAALYFLSGATGLCYEILWARMLSAQFGVSILGAAATVTAFLLGLGLGSLAVARWRAAAGRPAPGVGRALRIFAALELAVALYALALPQINALGAPVLEALAPQMPWWQWQLVQGLAALVLLTLPAAAMGASFPMVLDALPWSAERVGRMYGINSLGAATGALLSLVLLAGLGWSAALRAVAACGFFVAAGAWLLGRSQAQAEVPADVPAQAPATGTDASGRLGLRYSLAYAGAGACALMLEIAWTRLYAMVMLRTEYVLAIILAVYLLGTALGSLLAARAPRRRWPEAAVPLAACACALLGLWSLPLLSAWVQNQRFASLPGALATEALALALCTLPTTVALGAWLPLLAHRLGGGGAGRGAQAVTLYGANCLGAAAGGAFTVLVAIPLWGTTASICLAAVLLLALGLALGAPRALIGALPLAIAAAWLLRAFPSPQQMQAPGAADSVELYRYEDALSLNHVIESASGQRTLLTDLQHMDASSDPAAVQIQADQARLALLLHPAPQSILFLGLGTGISASGALAFPRLQATAVELSPGAIRAAQQWFAAVNHGVTANLQLEHDDARHYLAAHAQRFDVIVGDLFHPDLAGMSNLLSVEQFERARSRLQVHGIFTQWLALNQFDRDSLRVVLRSFQRVFPDARLYLDGMHLAMVGSASADSGDAAAMAQNLARMDADAAERATGQEGAATWLGRYWGPIAAGIGPVQSESRPVIEYRLPQLRYLEPAPLPEILLEMLRQRPDAQTARAQLRVPAGQEAAFENAYIANELAVQSWIAAIAAREQRESMGGGEALARQARQLTRLAYESNPRDHWIASALADELYARAAQGPGPVERAALERILRIFPDHLDSLRALWHIELAAEPARAPPLLARLRDLAPLDREVREAIEHSGPPR